jgi:hypothetical protein
MTPRTFSSSDASAVLHRLVLSYGQPFGLSSGALEDLAKEWARILDDCTPADVNTAVDEYTKRNAKWPTASKIRDEALKLAGTRRQAEPKFVDGEFCPMCHTHDLISVGKHQRFMPFHAENCPGLHESDRTELRAAIEAGNYVWHNGKPEAQASTAARLATHQHRNPVEIPV